VPPSLVILHGVVQASVLEGERPLGRASCFGVEGSSPKWTELVNGDGESGRGNL
jgi:hypothetical protein